MDEITTILLDIQDQLGKTVPELAYVDKDWGQLSQEKPAVKFPCALLDLKDIKFSQTGNGGQVADTEITVTVANIRLTPSSISAPKREEAYQIIGLLAKIHAALHTFSTGDYAPLFRTKLRKVVADSSRECYELTYQTAYVVGFDKDLSTARVTKVRLDIQ